MLYLRERYSHLNNTVNIGFIAILKIVREKNVLFPFYLSYIKKGWFPNKLYAASILFSLKSVRIKYTNRNCKNTVGVPERIEVKICEQEQN